MYGPLDRHRARQGVQHRWEDHHQPVAQVLHLVAAARHHSLAEELNMSASHLLGGVVPQPSEQLGRPHEVGEQQRDDLGRPVGPSPSSHPMIVRTVFPSRHRSASGVD